MMSWHHLHYVWAAALLLGAQIVAAAPPALSCTASPLFLQHFCPSTVIDAKSKSWAPWSYKPVCVKTSFKKLSQVCVFSFTEFRGGRGVSIVGSPELAAGLVDKLDDGVVKPEMRNHPSMSVSPKAADLPFVVKEIEGKGKGLVATRKIAKWEVIIVDPPALIIDNKLSQVMTQTQRTKLMDLALKQLPAARRGAVLSLSAAVDEHTPEADKGDIEDILKMNVFSMDMFMYPFGLFTQGARLNHDCKANAFWRFQKSSLAQEYLAMKEIKEGEEITHSYVAIGLNFKDRTSTLMDWGFQCKCSLCQGSTDDLKVSDMRRDMLRGAIKALREGKDENDIPIDESGVAERINSSNFLIDNENMWPVLCQVYQEVSEAYLRLNNIGKARKYVRAAERMCEKIGGDDHGSSKNIYDLWEGVKAGSTYVKGT